MDTKLETSRFMAEREFGKETVEAAFEYFNQHPAQSGALLAHPSPFHAAIEIYNQNKVATEIGNDPNGWMKAREAEITAKVRKELEAEMVTKQAKDAAAIAAPSMADVTGTGGGPKTTFTGPTPLTDVIGG